MSELNIPLELAELLHATLGPLATSLRAEGNHWADTIDYIVDKYTRQRDAALYAAHGPSVKADINHATFKAVDSVLAHMDDMFDEKEHFGMWTDEFKGA